MVLDCNKKEDAKPKLIWWVLILKWFDFEIRDRKSCENQVSNYCCDIRQMD